MPEPTKCALCGEPMPEGETMFFHGYSGNCPKPPKKVPLDPADVSSIKLTVLERKAEEALKTLQASADGGLTQLPVHIRWKSRLY